MRDDVLKASEKKLQRNQYRFQAKYQNIKEIVATKPVGTEIIYHIEVEEKAKANDYYRNT